MATEMSGQAALSKVGTEREDWIGGSDAEYCIFPLDNIALRDDDAVIILPGVLSKSELALRMEHLTQVGYQSRLSSAADSDSALQRYQGRLAELREAAEEEGIAWNDASEQGFRAFVAANAGWRKAGLSLMDNGNLRAVWEWPSDDDTHLALQFLGNEHVQYVIFKHRPGAGKVSRVAGSDTFDGIKRQVAAFALNQLVYSDDKPAT